MGQTVKLRRSAISGKIPINSQLLLGELSMNTTDGKIFLSKSGSNGPSVEEVIITNTQNFGNIDLVGDLTATNISSSFIGDGSGLYNIPASGVTGLSLDRIASSTSTASIDADGLHINTDTTVTGSLTATEFTGSGLGLTDVPIKISGSDAGSTSIDSTFTRIKFDDSTGIKISGTTGGDAVVFLSGVAAESESSEGRTAKLEVTSATSTWTLNHNLNEKHPSIEVFDSNDEVIIPQKIEATSVNQVVVSFASPQTGTVTATVGGGLPTIESGYTDRVLSVDSNGIATWKTGILSGSIDFSTLVDTGSFNTYTSSNDNTNSDQNGRLDSLEEFTSSIDDTYATDTDVTTLRTDLNTYTSSTDGRLDSLETTSGPHDGRLDSIESITSSHNSRLNSLETTSGSHDGRLDSIESKTGSFLVSNDLSTIEGKIGSLETTSGSHDGRITDLETFETKVDTGLEFTGSNVTIKGNLLVKGTETRVDSTTVDIDDNILSLNGSGAANAGIEVRDTESPGVLSGSLIYDTGDNTWKAGIKGSEERLLINSDLTTLDGRLDSLESTSGSHEDRIDRIEISTSSLNSFTSSINTTIKNKLNTDGVISGSVQIDHDATTNYESNEHIDHSTITIGSGKGLTGGGTIDTSRSLTLNTGSNHFLDGVKSKLNTETVVSGSAQIDITGTTNYNLVDGRLDSLEEFTSSIDDTYATDNDVTDLRNDLNSYTSSNDDTNSTQNGRLNSLETTSGSHDSRLDSIESNTGSYLTSYNDEYTTGATFSTSNGVVTFTRNDGDQYNVDLDGRYLTSFTETDPIFTAHASYDITSTQISNWDTAYGWGDHSQAGYLTAYNNEYTTGATFNGSNGVITFTRNDGDQFTVDLDGRYLTSFTETDPIFTASPSAGITDTNIDNWNTAYGWGDHSQAGYLTSYTESDTLNSVTTRGANTVNNITTGIHTINKTTSTSGTQGTTLLELVNNVGGDLSQQQTFIDFKFTDTNDNWTPQVRIGAQVGQDASADSQNTEGAGAFVVYTGDGSSTSGTLNESLRISYDGDATIQGTLSASGYNDGNWNTAYGWGDHSQVGYLTSYNNEYTTGATFNGSNGIITFTRNDGDTYTLNISSTLTDINVTGGTYNDSTQTLTLNKSNGTSVDVTGFAVDTVLHTTGATFNSGNGVVTFTKNGGDTYTVDLDGRYLTSFTETDPIFTAHVVYDITSTQISNWDTAYGWGDHSQAGYLTTYNDEYTTGATFNNGNGVITFTRNDGDTFTVDIDGRYLTSFTETDPIFTASPSAGITDTNISNWNTAYGWGDHGSAGYLTSYTEVDTLDSVTTRGATTSNDITISHDSTPKLIITDTTNNLTGQVRVANSYMYVNVDSSDSVNSTRLVFQTDGVTALYLNGNQQAYFSSDVDVSSGNIDMGTNIITDTKVGQWDTAYGWGDHSQVGYLTTYNDEYTTGATFNGGNGIITFTRNDGDQYTVDISSTLTDVTVTGGTYNDGTQTLTLTKSDGDTVDVTGFAIESVKFTTGATFNDSNGIITFTNNDNTTYTVDIDDRYLQLGGGTLTGNLTLNSTNPEILFNGTSDAGVDMAIKATPEGLDFYEPEDGNKIHFQILDDAGVNSTYGYKVGNTVVINSSRVLSNVTGNISMFTNDSNYLTSFTETDPIFTASPSAGITDTNIDNWNTAYGWGDHSQAGYLTAHPNISAASSSNNGGRTYIQDILLDSNGHVTGLTTASESVVNTDEYTTGATFNTGTGVITFTRNDGDTYTVDIDGRFLTSFTETDPIFTASPSAGITDTNIDNWNTAYGWGDHSQAGYVTSSGNTVIGTDQDIDTSGSYVVNQLTMTDGVITSHSTRQLSQLKIPDTRTAEKSPNDYTSQHLSLDFTDEFGSLGSWYSGITLKGWTGTYAAWQLISEADSGIGDTNLYFRQGNGTTWQSMRTVWTSANFADNSSNWNTAYGWGDHSQEGYLTSYNDEYTTGATFNGTNGIITFTRNDGDTYTVDISSTLTDINVTGGTYNDSTQTLTLNKSNGNSVDVTGFAVDTVLHTTGATFNSGDGVITFTKNGGDTYTVDLDGRYLRSYSETDTLDSVTTRGSTTSNDLTVGGLTISDTFPYLDFVDTNSFTDPADRFRVRAGGNNGMIQWSDSSAGTTTTLMTFLPDGKITMGNGIQFTATGGIDMGSNTITDVKVGQWNTAYGWGDHSQAGYLTSQDDDLPIGGGTLTGGLTIAGSVDSGASDMGYYQSAGTNLILKGDSVGRSGIFFESEKDGTNINDPSDYGFIQFHSYGYGNTSGEANNLIIGVSNDSTDKLILQAPYNGGVMIGYKGATSGTGLTLSEVIHSNSSSYNNGNWDTAYGWGDHSLAGYTGDQDLSGYLLNSTDTFVGALSISGDIRGTGQQLILNAGESYAYAAGQTNEYVYINAEQGLEVNSETGNWTGGWAARKTALLRGDLLRLDGEDLTKTNIQNFKTAYGWGDHNGVYLPIAGKAADSDKLDGINSSEFLRSNANDSFTGTITMATQKALVANNYGRGVYGLYSATRYQHVWSMGTAYNLSDDGTTSGNLYGLAFTHTNVGGQSKDGLAHQLLIMDNGVTKSAIGRGIWTDGTITTTNHGTSEKWNDAYGWGDHASGGYLTSSSTLNASNMTTGTLPDVFSSSTRYNIGLIDGNGSQTRDKIRVWTSDQYTIGMKSGYQFGHLGNNYAMSFQMNADADRGFWWGTDGDSDNQGAMALTTDGRANIKKSLSIGQGNTTTPSSTPLYVEGTTAGATVFEVHGTQGPLFSISDDMTGDIFEVSDISGVPILTVNASGTVTIDDTLHVKGDVIAYHSSDERLKDNIKPILNPLDKIKLIGGYEFDWNEQSKNEGHDVGVIAQEIEEVLPELVSTRNDGYKGVKYEKITALLIEANKELLNRVEELEKKLTEK